MNAGVAAVLCGVVGLGLGAALDHELAGTWTLTPIPDQAMAWRFNTRTGATELCFYRGDGSTCHALPAPGAAP